LARQESLRGFRTLLGKDNGTQASGFPLFRRDLVQRVAQKVFVVEIDAV